MTAPLTLLIGQSNAMNRELVSAVAWAVDGWGGQLAKLAVPGSVMAPVPGTAHGSWSPALRGQLFDDLADSIEDFREDADLTGTPFEIASVILVQGEGDTWGGMASASYLANLSAFFTQLTALVPVGTIVCSALSAVAGPARSLRRGAGWRKVRRQQFAFATGTPGTRLVDPDSLGYTADRMFLADGVHYNAATGFAGHLGRELGRAAQPRRTRGPVRLPNHHVAA